MTSLTETFAALLRHSEQSEEYWLDIAISDFARDLHARLESMGVTHKELADRMGTSRPYVTKLLNGGNFTLHTMVKIAMALDAVVRVRLEGREQREVERITPGRSAAGGETVVSLAKHLEGRQKVITTVSAERLVAGRRR